MIQLFKPYMPKMPELEYVLNSGKLAYGSYTQEFEKALMEYFGTPYVIVTNTFSAAVSVAMTTLGLSFGDEVIASPMACLVSTQPYISSGYKIRWCDVDSKRGTLSPEALRKKINSNTKAIIHNHFCGYPGYIDEINSIGKEFGIPVVDDGIECFGSEYKGKKIGNCGSDVTVFSFSAVRIPNTIDGGAVIFKDEKLYKKSLRIRDSGIDRSRFRDELGEISLECDITEIGYSVTMSNLNGYIGTQQMKDVPSLINQQRSNAAFINKYLASIDGVEPIISPYGNPNYWVYGLRATDKKNTIIAFRKKSLYASGVHINNNRYAVFGDTRELQGVNEFYQHFVAIPCGWWMEAKECLKI